MTRPLPPHGTTARAKGRPAAGVAGCPCPDCRRAEYRYDKRRHVLNLSSDTTLLVDAAPVAAHLHTLKSAGAGWAQLQQLTGCSTSTLHALLNGTQERRMRRSVANRILAVSPGLGIPAARLIPAIGSVRRAQALLAAGHPMHVIRAESGVERTTVCALVAGRHDRVRAMTADRVRDAYTTLAHRVGDSARSRNRAVRNGWPTPDFWEDYSDRIDDEEFDPATAERPTPRYIQLAEDWAWLLQQGYTRAQAAMRLGTSRDALQAAISRYAQRYGSAA